MANSNRPDGLKPAGEIIHQAVYVASAATAVGDAVKLGSDGKVAPAATGGSGYTSVLVGVSLSRASADGDEINVADAPQQEFEIQCHGGSISAQTALNLNYGLLCTDPVSGESRMELDDSTGATTSTLSLKALRLHKVANDNAFGANAKVIVKINNHSLSGGTGTAGI